VAFFGGQCRSVHGLSLMQQAGGRAIFSPRP
jgi:hypothetical protein